MVFSVVVVMSLAIGGYAVGKERELGLVSEETVAVASRNVQTELPPLKLYAQGAVLMDAKSGRVLYSKNGEEQLPMASTTKIMTLIVTLERANLDDIVTVSSYAASMPNVQLHIREGEQYRLRDLLYSLMLESHNDSAVAIAEHVGGSVEEFAVLMNQKAQEIGCKDTWFITPNGLDATAEYSNAVGEKELKNHSTTAKDLARIMAYCVLESPNKEQFIEDIKAMTVLELSELVKALEEEFGVSAAATAVAVAGPAVAAAEVEEKTEFDVILKDVGPEKIKVIKVVRELTGLGLKEAKDVVDNAPKPLKEGIDKEAAEKIVAAFKEVGATCEIK